MRWKITNEARSADVAITTLYPTSASGIIVLLKAPRLFSLTPTPTIFAHIPWPEKESKLRNHNIPWLVFNKNSYMYTSPVNDLFISHFFSL